MPFPPSTSGRTSRPEIINGFSAITSRLPYRPAPAPLQHGDRSARRRRLVPGRRLDLDIGAETELAEQLDDLQERGYPLAGESPVEPGTGVVATQGRERQKRRRAAAVGGTIDLVV